LSTVLALVILALIPRFENRLENDWYSNLRVSFHPTECGVKEAVKVIESLHMKVKGVDWKEDMTTHERTLLFHVKYKKGDRLTLPGKVMDALRALPDVKSVDWHG
jgi:hypothetical protein